MLVRLLVTFIAVFICVSIILSIQFSWLSSLCCQLKKKFKKRKNSVILDLLRYHISVLVHPVLRWDVAVARVQILPYWRGSTIPGSLTDLCPETLPFCARTAKWLDWSVDLSLLARELRPLSQAESRFGLAVRLVSRGTSVRICFGSPFSSKVVVCGLCLVTLSLTIMKH